jgi:hypothetical protein
MIRKTDIYTSVCWGTFLWRKCTVNVFGEQFWLWRVNRHHVPTWKSKVRTQWGTWLIIDGAVSGVTKIRHDVTFPLSTSHRGKDRVHFSTLFIQRKTLSMAASCIFFIGKTGEISRTLRLMHGGICFDKILPKQVGYFGTRITLNTIENSVATLAAPRHGLIQSLTI